jgi:CRISPR-associated protein Cas2
MEVPKVQCLVVYDISNDRVRSKVADFCLDYGLERIQFSAFLGDLARTYQEELLIKIKKQLGRRAGNVQLFPICDKDWRMRLVIDQKDKKEKDKAEPA